MHTTDTLNKKTGRFSKSSYDKINIMSNYSVADEELQFTNFLKENGSPNEKAILREVNEKLVIQNKNIDCMFKGTEIFINSKSENRMLDILNLYGFNLTKDDITSIRKFKHIKRPNVQLYCISDNDLLNVIAIDTHHLIIPSEYMATIRHSTIKSDYTKVYDKHKKNTFDINRILIDTNQKKELSKE